jgi:hypothetical protein
MRRPKNSLSLVLKKLIISVLIIFFIGFVLFIWQYTNRYKNSKETDYSFSSIKISILNGCGKINAATEVKDYLYDKGINNLDIISWKNVPRQMFIYDKSLIVVKKGDDEKLNFLMNLTGIHRRIYAENDQFIEEFQIILGNDYNQYFR